MGLAVDQEGNGGKDCAKRGSDLISDFSMKMDDGAVVYQLVRVEGDGSLVPATDDEVWKVEQLLEDERSEVPLIDGPKYVERCFSIEALASKKPESECSEGLPQSEVTDVGSQKLNARHESIEVMLQNVNKEEKQWLSSESLLASPEFADYDGHLSDQQKHLLVCDDQLQAENTLQPIPSHVRQLDGSRIAELCREETCQDTFSKINASSVSPAQVSTEFDSSTSKGGVYLDNLTIRELQQVFLATYGRETTVKDKMWLKRRLAMGLNDPSKRLASTDPKETLTVTDKLKEIGRFKYVALQRGQLARSMSANPDFTSKMEDAQILSNKRLRKPVGECVRKNEYFLMEQTAAKRLRKPTRRFIEEPSEVQSWKCSGRPLSSRDCGSYTMTSGEVFCSTVFGTRHDCLGGSGVQIPFVHRLRRGRPRKNLVSLMVHIVGASNCHQESRRCENATKVEQTTQGFIVPKHDGKGRSIRCRARSIPMRIPQRNNVGSAGEKGATKIFDDDEHMEDGELSSNGDDSYGTSGPATNSKCSFRRKHHRAWSLSEVMKLIEGVARYGAGRWSEIKRLAFASYSYRTSVDLKDKWRNLLRASFAHDRMGKEQRNIKRHPPSPIPLSILLRVRELAGLPHTAKEFRPAKSGSCRGAIVQEKRSGFL